jgi:hypothetical protein
MKGIPELELTIKFVQAMVVNVNDSDKRRPMLSDLQLDDVNSVHTLTKDTAVRWLTKFKSLDSLVTNIQYVIQVLEIECLGLKKKEKESDFSADKLLSKARSVEFLADCAVLHGVLKVNYYTCIPFQNLCLDAFTVDDLLQGMQNRLNDFEISNGAQALLQRWISEKEFENKYSMVVAEDVRVRMKDLVHRFVDNVKKGCERRLG